MLKAKVWPQFEAAFRAKGTSFDQVKGLADDDLKTLSETVESQILLNLLLYLQSSRGELEL